MESNDKVFYKQLETINACNPALKWVGNKTLHEAWNVCERGDWMLWLAAMVEIDQKVLVLAVCECARLSLHLVPEGEELPRKAIETVEAWANGNASLEDVKKVEKEAWDYYFAARVARAGWAVQEALAARQALAAQEARAAQRAARVAEYNPKKSADIIRKHISENDICRLMP